MSNAEGASAPAEKITNMTMPATALDAPKVEPANDTTAPPAKTDANAEADGGKGGEPEKPADVAPPAEPKPDKLERARRVARERHQQWQARVAAQAEAQRQGHAAQQYQQLALAERQQREAYERRLAEITRDPMAALAHLERAGLDPKTLTQKAIEFNSPEGKLRADLEQRFEERLQSELQKRDDILRQYQEREAAAQRATAQTAARERFLSEASDENKFPAVAQVAALGGEWKASLLREATTVLQEAFQRTGQEYTNEEVLSYLDTKYAKLMPAKVKEGLAKSKAGTEATKDTLNGSGAEAKDTAGGSRTLTNKDAQVKGSLPPNFDSLSDADQKKALAAMLRQLSRG